MEVFSARETRNDITNVPSITMITRPSTSSCRTVTSRHSLIYQSFTKPATDSDDSDSSTCTDDEEKFFLDKKSSETSKLAKQDFVIDRTSKMTNTHETEVDVFDLSNIETITVSDKDCDNIGARDESLQPERQAELSRSNIEKKKEEDMSKHKINELSSRLQAQTDTSLYLNVDPFKHPENKKHQTDKKGDLEVMKKSVIGDEFEKQESVTSTTDSVRKQKRQRKLEREKTKGDKWFNLPATEMTEERKRDFAVLQMRKALDPKRFYKENDSEAPPKYFQFGKVVETAADFYNSRIPKKQQKASLVEELLADAQFRQYNKRKYEEIQEVKRQGKGPYRHMKRLRKRKR